MAKVDLFPDFKDLLSLLTKAKVKFLVIGGYAVIHYGYDRSTGDIDIWIAIDPKNVDKVCKVLWRFGNYSHSEVNPGTFKLPGKILVLGREPNRIDVLTGPAGVSFDACYRRRHKVTWDGIVVPLISLEDLRINKRAAGRSKDLADIQYLAEAEAKKQRPRRRGAD